MFPKPPESSAAAGSARETCVGVAVMSALEILGAFLIVLFLAALVEFDPKAREH